MHSVRAHALVAEADFNVGYAAGCRRVDIAGHLIYVRLEGTLDLRSVPTVRMMVFSVERKSEISLIMTSQFRSTVSTTSRRHASPRPSQPVAGSSTSRRIAGGLPTPKATNW